MLIYDLDKKYIEDDTTKFYTVILGADALRNVYEQKELQELIRELTKENYECEVKFVAQEKRITALILARKKDIELKKEIDDLEK